jgi:hypothetical protein
MHASGNKYGSIGRLIVEAQGDLAKTELDVIDRANAATYWERESKHDTVISLTYGRAALDALGKVIEAWIAHFLKIGATAKPIRRIDEEHWAWHVGLDAESTAILNELWNGSQVEQGRMQRILALFELKFADAGRHAPRHRRPPDLSRALVRRRRRGADEAAEPATESAAA